MSLFRRRERLTEREAAIRFMAEMWDVVLATWPKCAESLVEMFGDRVVVLRTKEAIPEVMLAALAMDSRAVGNLWDHATSERVDQHIAGQLPNAGPVFLAHVERWNLAMRGQGNPPDVEMVFAMMERLAIGDLARNPLVTQMIRTYLLTYVGWWAEFSKSSRLTR